MDIGDHLLVGIREYLFSRATPALTQHLSVRRSKAPGRLNAMSCIPLAVDKVRSTSGLTRFLEADDDDQVAVEPHGRATSSGGSAETQSDA